MCFSKSPAQDCVIGGHIIVHNLHYSATLLNHEVNVLESFSQIFGNKKVAYFSEVLANFKLNN
jgi:hypothetical protein